MATVGIQLDIEDRRVQNLKNKLLQELHDKQAIRDHLARYCEMVDEYKLDKLTDLFTADCLCDYGPGKGGPMTGAEAQRDRIQRSLKRYRRTHHQLGQIRIELDGDRASSIAYTIADHEDHEGRLLSVRLQYRDRWVRTPTGWRISHRQMLASLITGADGAEFARLPRKDAL